LDEKLRVQRSPSEFVRVHRPLSEEVWLVVGVHPECTASDEVKWDAARQSDDAVRFVEPARHVSDEVCVRQSDPVRVVRVVEPARHSELMVRCVCMLPPSAELERGGTGSVPARRRRECRGEARAGDCAECTERSEGV